MHLGDSMTLQDLMLKLKSCSREDLYKMDQSQLMKIHQIVTGNFIKSKYLSKDKLIEEIKASSERYVSRMILEGKVRIDSNGTVIKVV